MKSIWALFLISASTICVSAQTTTYSDRATWLGATSNVTSVDLEPFSVNGFNDGRGHNGHKYEEGVLINGITFSNSAGELYVMDGAFDNNCCYGHGAGVFTIMADSSPVNLNLGLDGLTGTFDHAVTSFGLNLTVAVVNPPIVVTLSDGESFTVVTGGGTPINGFPGGHIFFGFTSSNPISGFNVQIATGVGGNENHDWVIAGDMQYGNANETPEPSSLLLLASGLLGTWKRRSATK